MSIYDFFEDAHKERYEETEDPVHIWHLINFLDSAYISRERQFPDWVKTYLSETAKNIMKIDSQGKWFPSVIVKALGSPKQKTISKIIKDDRDDLLSQMIEQCHKDGNKLDECYSLIADEFNMATSTVKDKYKKYRSRENKDKY